MQQAEIVPIFSWTHYATDGKLDNITEVIDEMSSIFHIGLHILDPGIDAPLLDEEEILNRLARIKKVIGKLKRHHSLQAELILPGIEAGLTFEPAAKQRLQFLYAHATQTGAKTIWADHYSDGLAAQWLSDPLLRAFRQNSGNRVTDKQAFARSLCHPATAKEKETAKAWVSFQRSQVRSLVTAVRQAVKQQGLKIKLGLIATPASTENQAIPPADMAKLLSLNGKPLLVTGPDQALDKQRLDIVAAFHVSPPRTGLTDATSASSFHKAAESMQVEFNLNLFHGKNRIFLDAFDRSGTAPTAANPYLKMIGNREKMMDKLYDLLPAHPRPVGFRILVNEGESSPFSALLSRMGLPLMIETPQAHTFESSPTANVLTPAVCASLKRRQLDRLFAQGVLIDATAAEILQNRGYEDLLGATVGGPVDQVQFEIISYQAFAAPFYGHRTQLTGYYRHQDFRLLKPVHERTQTITTLVQAGQSPTIPGMSLYDDPVKKRRCAILPYSLAAGGIDPLLTLQRQRHFADLLVNLAEAPLLCFVENAPDLVPFYVPDPQGRRVVLGLLNLSFDWAINTRIRLGQLPQRIKKVRELTEEGTLEQYRDFPLHRDGPYAYLQLTPDTAIPPMQMGIFILN